MPSSRVNDAAVETIGSPADARQQPRFRRVTLRLGAGEAGDPDLPAPAARVPFPGMTVARRWDFAAKVFRCVDLTPYGGIVLAVGGRAADGHPGDRIMATLADPEAAARTGPDPPALLAEAAGHIPAPLALDIPTDCDAGPAGPRGIDTPFTCLRHPDRWRLPYRQLDVRRKRGGARAPRGASAPARSPGRRTRGGGVRTGGRSSMALADLGVARLATGEALRLAVVEAPDAEWAPRLQGLLGHKSPVYRDHIRAALSGPLDELQTLFYVGLIGSEPVTHAMVTGANGAGILGHVYTVADWRRRGAAGALHHVLEPDVRARGYRCLTLGTNPEGHARRIYEGIGFRQVTPGSGDMRWGDGTPPDGEWEVGRARWADWGWISAAACAAVGADEELPRSRLLGVHGPSHVEGQFAGAMGAGRPLVVVRRGGAAVGWAELSAAAGALLGAVALDFYVRPECWDGAAVLLGALEWPGGGRPVLGAASGERRGEALRAAGFARAAHVARLGDVTLWVRGSAG